MFELTVTDPQGAEDRDQVQVTIEADNDPATIAGQRTGEVTEDAEPTVTGQLSVTDPDGADRFLVPADPGLVGIYGTFTLTAEGAWAYTLDNDDPDTDALAANARVTDTFTVRPEDPGDSAEARVTITIIGANDPAVAITGQTTGAVTAVPAATEPTLATGTLSVDDPDGPGTVQARENPGAYGVFRVTAQGVWTYTLNNADRDTIALAAGDTATDVFTVTADDGITTTVTITVTGADDPVTITGTTTGAVTEGRGPFSGTLTATDPDSPASPVPFQALTTPGLYGTFSVTEGGVWRYTLDNENAATNALAADATETERFTVTADGITTTVTITVTGTDDPSTIGGDLTGAVTDNALTTTDSGTLIAIDPDEIETPIEFATITFTLPTSAGGPYGGAGAGIYGGLELAATGEWTYTLNTDDADTNALVAGATATDEFTIMATNDDVDDAVITITITGADDPVVFSGFTGSTTEDEFIGGFNEITGFLSATDPDDPGLRYTFRLAPGDFQGTYGTFTLNAGGLPRWRYRLDNADADTNALAAGATVTDTFSVMVADEDGNDITDVTPAVTITVTGANDAPTANAGSDQPAVISGATVTLDGRGSTDPDTGDTIDTYTWTQRGSPTVTLSATDVARPTFTAPDVPSATALTFELVVNDGSVDSAADTVTITVTDDAVVGGIVLSPASLTVSETGSASYNVSLSVAPLGPVDVAIADGAGSGGLTFDPTALVFDASNWNVAQAVTVTADSGAPSGSRTHTASGSGYSATQDLSVTVLPQPGLVQNFTVTPRPFGRARVVLNWAAPANAVVAEVTGYELQRRPRSATDFVPLATLPFGDTTTQYFLPPGNSARSFEFRIRALAAGVVGDWVSTDPSPGALLSVNTLLEIAEGGTATYTVVLQTQPTASVTVVISSNNDDVTATDLTFTVTNWNMPQAVVVSAAQDADSVNDVGISLTHDFQGGGYGSVSARVDVSVVDDDTAQLSVVAATVTEGGSATVEVSLDRAVGERFTVNFATQEGGTATVVDDYTATSGTLTFAGTAGEVQTFTVATVPDEMAESAETVQVSLSGLTPSDLPIDITGVTNVDAVTITDDDAVVDGAGIVLLPASLTVSETGSASYNVSLSVAPLGRVDVAIVAIADGVDLGGLTFDPTTLTFNESTWNVGQAVTVAAAAGILADAGSRSLALAIRHTASGGGYDATQDLSLTLLEQPGDVQGFSSTPLNRLIALTWEAPFNADAAAVTGYELQRRGIDATDYEDSRTFPPDATSARYFFTRSTPPASVFRIRALAAGVVGEWVETASPGALLSVNTLLEIDEGGTAAYTVVLRAVPTAPVTVEIRSNNDDVTTDVPTTGLTFTVANWNMPQEVTVTAAQDDDASDDVGISLTHVFSGGGYDSVRARVDVDVVDDDPTFGTTTIADQTYTAGVDIGSVTLPTATSGNGALTYTLTPLPAGLTLTDNILSGIPETMQATTNLAYTVTDGDGNADTIDFTITINATTIIDDLTGEVTEGGVVVETIATDTGRLFLPGGFVAQTGDDATTGTYGSFTLTNDGVWTYTLNNAAPDTNALAGGVRVTDVFTAVSAANTSETQAVTITVTGANDAPTAMAGDDRTVPQGATVELIGRGTDPDTGDAAELTYAWTQTGGTPTVTLVPGMDDTTVNFAAPTVDGANTTLTFTLTVTDRQTVADTDTVTVTIDSSRTASTITGDIFGGITEDADPNTAIGVLTVTDGGGDVRDFAAQAVPGTYGSFTLADTGVWTYTLNNENIVINALPLGSEEIQETFRVVAADSTPAIVTIFINGANDLPTVEVEPTQTVVEETLVTLTGTGDDVDTGDLLRYQWTQIDFELDDPTAVTRQVTLTNADTATATFTAPNFLEATPLTFTLTVADVHSAGVTATVIVTVTANDDPVLIGGEQTGSVTEDGAVLARGELTIRDPDGHDRFQAQTDVAGVYGTLDSLTATGVWVYALNNNDEVVQNLRATDVRTETFTVRAEDDTPVILTITVNGANDAPTATGRFRSDAVIIDSSVIGGSEVSLVGTGTDRDTGEQEALRYAWRQVSGQPDVTLTAADTATATFTAPTLPAETTLVFELTVTDGQEATAIAPVRVLVRAADNIPAVFGGTRGRVTEDGEPTATDMLTVTDADGSDNTVQPQADIVGAYGRFTLNAATRVWSYTLNNDTDAVQGLAANEAVRERFAVRAADGTRGEVVITVHGANDAPTVTATSEPVTANEGTTVTLTGTGTDPDRQDRLRYQWTPPAGIPTSGLLPSATSARITFAVPDLPGDTALTFTLTVTDPSEVTATAMVTVMVTAENDAATFGGTHTGTVIENDSANSVAAGVLTVSDPDTLHRFTAQTDLAGTYGRFTLFADGRWRYVLDNDDLDTNALAASEEATDRFPVTTEDGTPFQLTTTDGTTPTEVDAVVITVTGFNDPPTVDAGAAQFVPTGSTVTLAGIVSDPESSAEALTYAWTQTGAPAVDLAGDATATATFLAPPVPADTPLTFTLTVTAPAAPGETSETGAQQTVMDTVIVTVRPFSVPAVFSGVRTGGVTEDAPTNTATATLTVTDADGPNLARAQTDIAGTYGRFSIVDTGEWIYTLNNAVDAPTQALAANQQVTERFTVQAVDGTPDAVVITVTGANDAPSATIDEPAQSANEGTLVTLSGRGRDPDTLDRLTYAWTQLSGHGRDRVTLSNIESPDNTMTMVSFTAPEISAATPLTLS